MKKYILSDFLVWIFSKTFLRFPNTILVIITTISSYYLSDLTHGKQNYIFIWICYFMLVLIIFFILYICKVKWYRNWLDCKYDKILN